MLGVRQLSYLQQVLKATGPAYLQQLSWLSRSCITLLFLQLTWRALTCLPENFHICILNMWGRHYFSVPIVYPGCCSLAHLLHLFNMNMCIGLKNNKHIFCACVRSISKLIFLQAVVVEGLRVLKLLVLPFCVISLLLSSVVKPPTLILLARKSGMWRPNWYVLLYSFLASRIQVTKFFSLSGKGDPLVSGCPSTH